MALNRTSDSLSKCDPSLYSNIYDTRKRTDVKIQPVSTPPIQKDTIEISSDKLKEEALQRLRHTSSYVIAQNSFMRVGKYLFLAIAFPPYLLLYGLPKWIIIEGIPAVFSLLVTLWKNVQQKTEGQFAKGAVKAEQLFQYVRTMAQNLIQPVGQLAFAFLQTIRRGNRFFKKILETGKQALLSPMQKLTNGIGRFHKKSKLAKEKLFQKVQVLAGHAQEGIQWIKQAPLAFLGWGQAQLQRVRDQSESAQASLGARWHSSRKLAQQGTDWVFSQVQRELGRIKKAFKPMAVFCRGRILPNCKRAMLSLQEKGRKVRDFFHRRHQQSLAFLEKKQNRLKQLSHHYFINRLMSQGWLPNSIKTWLNKWLSHPFVKAICEGIIHLYSFIARGCFAAVSILLRGLANGARLCVRLGYHAKVISLKVATVLGTGYRLCRKCILYALYYSILYVLIAVIGLGRCFLAFMRIMSSSMAQIGKWMRQTTQPLKIKD